MEEKKNNELVKAVENTPVMPFANTEGFELAQRMAKSLAASSLVPKDYQGTAGLPNCLIALEMAQRVGMSPFLVMQNLHVIQGRPSWSSTYLIAAVNTSGKFSPLRFHMEKKGKKKADYTYNVWSGAQGSRSKQTKTETYEIEEITCVAYATELATGETLKGPEVSMSMAVAEGWYSKDGSKWKTMPELMLRYRAAAFFSRMYCPEVAMGMHTAEEVYDVYDATPARESTQEQANKLTEELLGADPAPEIETEFIPADEDPEPEPAPVPEPAIETPAPPAPKRSEPKQTPQPAQQAPLLPPDDAFDFPETDDSDAEALF